MAIKDINVKIILDSREKETLEAEIIAEQGEKFSVKASVPSGKSTGSHEVFVLDTGKALEKFSLIKPEILAAFAAGRIESQKDFDNFLIFLDGTENKSNLGGNLILALSLAFARYKAKEQGQELYEYIINQQIKIDSQQHKIQKFPRPIFNVINGGAHSGILRKTPLISGGQAAVPAPLSFQEFQVIPDLNDFNMSLSVGMEFYRKLREFLEKKFGKENIVLGDEAGFSAPFKTNEEAIEILAELINKKKYPLQIGLDCAATNFYKINQQPKEKNMNGYYMVDGKEYSVEELTEYYLRLIETYKIISIEDPFHEESFEYFAKLNEKIRANPLPYSENPRKSDSMLVITDDLTTTNPKRLQKAINKKSGNSILIKLNQIGTLSETLDVVKLAYENNWQAVVSHRSGETMDDFIADLAVAIGAWGIKAGSPAKPERMAKYDRLLKIFSKLNF